MSRMSHWLAPVVFGVAVAGASLMPAPAHAQSGDLVRLLVGIGDVTFRGGHPYYRHHNSYGYNDRLVVVRDRYGRPAYYRNAPRTGYGVGYGSGYNSGYGYNTGYGFNNGARYGYGQPRQQQTRCDSRGRCVTQYYDSRYDRNNRYGQYDNRYYGRPYDSRYSNSGYRGWGY